MNAKQARAAQKAQWDAYQQGIKDGIRGTYTGVYGAVLLACERAGMDSDHAIELL